MSSAIPTNKVTAGVVAGAVAMIVTWAAKAFGHVDVPAEVVVGLSTVATFVVQYLTPDTKADA